MVSSKVMDSMSASPRNHKRDKKLFRMADLEEIAKIGEISKPSKLKIYMAGLDVRRGRPDLPASSTQEPIAKRLIANGWG